MPRSVRSSFRKHMQKNMRNKNKKYTYVVRIPLSARSSFRIALCKALWRKKIKKIHLRGENTAEREILFENCLVQGFGIRGIYSQTRAGSFVDDQVSVVIEEKNTLTDDQVS